MTAPSVEAAYALAVERYAALGVDVPGALEHLRRVPVSLHCWQGDDVGGFETKATGARRRTGRHRQLSRAARERQTNCGRTRRRRCRSSRAGTDSTCTLSTESLAASGRSRRHRVRSTSAAGSTGPSRSGSASTSTRRSSRIRRRPTTSRWRTPDAGIRQFWISHGHRMPPRSAPAFGEALGTARRHQPLDPGRHEGHADRSRRAARAADRCRWTRSSSEPVDRAAQLDALEGKLFGLGIESYTVGSHEFYFGYALHAKLLYTLDTGHYHPTETIADKISAVLVFMPETPPAREPRRPLGQRPRRRAERRLQAIGQELVRGHFLERTHLGLDFFDASINRVAAWVIGTRNMLKGLLAGIARARPPSCVRSEAAGDYTSRLALLRRNPRCCRSAPSGTTTVCRLAFRCAKRGSTRCSATSIAYSRPVHDRWPCPRAPAPT